MINSSLGAASAAYTFEEISAPPVTPAAINTPVAYAGFFVRLAAFVIDNLICYFAAYLTIWGAGAFYRAFHGAGLDGGIRFVLASILFYLLFYTVYFVYFLTHGGQTPGKQILGIKVVALDGGEVDGFRAALRTMGYAFSWFLFGLGYLWAGMDRHRQSWHDKLAGTVVLEI